MRTNYFLDVYLLFTSPCVRSSTHIHTHRNVGICVSSGEKCTPQMTTTAAAAALAATVFHAFHSVSLSVSRSNTIYRCRKGRIYRIECYFSCTISTSTATQTHTHADIESSALQTSTYQLSHWELCTVFSSFAAVKVFKHTFKQYRTKQLFGVFFFCFCFLSFSLHRYSVS